MGVRLAHDPGAVNKVNKVIKFFPGSQFESLDCLDFEEKYFAFLHLCKNDKAQATMDARRPQIKLF